MKDLGYNMGEFTGSNEENIADCFAGVWMANAYSRNVLTDTDYDEAIAALEALGVDRPGSSHGSAAVRKEALLLGYNGTGTYAAGDPLACVSTYAK